MKRKALAALLAALLLVSALPLSALADTAYNATATVTASWLRYRQGPSVNTASYAQEPRGTKVTISSADIPYITESVLHLYSLGIHEVNINVVFEDVWQEGDDLKFEEQLMQLADAIIDGGYYQDYACSFFSEHIGKPLDPERDNQNWCGAGKMLSVDAAGNLYPCTRFAQYSLRDKETWTIGNIHDGIDKNKLRPFLTLDRTTQSPQKCIECEVASGCAWCQGENFDAAQTHTVFERATAICLMHKARVRANNYYWNKLYRKLELEDLREQYEANKREVKPEIC